MDYQSCVAVIVIQLSTEKIGYRRTMERCNPNTNYWRPHWILSLLADEDFQQFHGIILGLDYMAALT